MKYKSSLIVLSSITAVLIFGFQNCSKMSSGQMRNYSLSSKSNNEPIIPFQPTQTSPSDFKSCIVGSVEILHNQSADFFSAQSADNCSTIKQNRKCNDGQISGSESFKFVSCVNNPPQPPSGSCSGIVGVDWNLGRIGFKYGSSYEAYKAELAGGEAIFRFYGNANVNYPAPLKNQAEADATPPNIGDLRSLFLLSHSVTARNELIDANVISKIHYKLWDQNGKLVAEVCDTKGGYHPGRRPNARGNNHTDDTNRWIKKGIYKIWYKNISEDSRAIQQFEWYKGDWNGAPSSTYRQNIQPGQEIEFVMDMNDESRYYKLNGNVLP